MQPDNPIQQTIYPAPSPNQPTSPTPSPQPPAYSQPIAVKNNKFEIAMLITAVIAIYGLLMQNGLVLKIGAFIFFAVAIVNIVRNLNKNKTQMITPASYPVSGSTVVPAAPPKSKVMNTALKGILVILVAIIAVPVILYGGMIVLMLILVAGSGGQGT